MTSLSEQKYICDIVPFTHIPLSREQFFWYSSPHKITPGTLVSIPLFRRIVRGTVLHCRKDTGAHRSIRLKSVERIIEKDYFTQNQIALALHISETTFTSLGTVLGQFYTSPTVERPSSAPALSHKKILPILPSSAHSLFDEILAHRTRYRHFLLRDTPDTIRDSLFFHVIDKILSDSDTAQILVLLPEILLSEQTARALRSHFFSKDIVVIHNKISKGALWKSYQRIRSGDVRIIVGTRKSLLMPFLNLSLIIIDEEHDMSFKQWDRAPRFDARTVAETLGRMHTCPLLSASASPRITRNVPTPLGPPHLAPSLTFIDMRSVHFERVKKSKGRKPAATLFSPELIDATKKALSNQKQALFFFNHKGMSAFSLCSDCGMLLACPDCDRALVLTSEGHYECFHCTYVTSIFPQCSACKSMSFRNVGYGTSKIETMLMKLFPHARIARVDGHSMRHTHAAKDLIEKFENHEIDIIIGTQMALKDWRSNNLNVVAILDADALLSIPDISADERLFAFISNAVAAVTHRNSSHGMVFVQTYKPDYHLFSHARTLDYIHFRTQTLADRKALHYPPYWRVIKVILQHKDSKKTSEIASEWHKKILHLNTSDTWEVSNVHAPLLPKLRGFYRQQIIIRIPNGTRTTAPIPETLATLFSATPPRTIIDVDPVSLV